jgi:hypothetical protein
MAETVNPLSTGDRHQRQRRKNGRRFCNRCASGVGTDFRQGPGRFKGSARRIGEICFRSDLAFSFGRRSGFGLDGVETDMGASFDIGSTIAPERLPGLVAFARHRSPRILRSHSGAGAACSRESAGARMPFSALEGR